jgi:hypothetical protein
MDHRDRLILALSALLRAEREAREAWDAALAADAISGQTLAALEGDPFAVLSEDDIELAEAFATPAGFKHRAINA